MKRLSFKDSRGDNYTFVLYNTNDVKITKTRMVGIGIHQIELSAEAVERFQELLEREE